MTNYIYSLSVTTTEVDVWGLLLGAAVSGSVISAVVAGIFQYAISRRNARVAETKNLVDAESALIARYREAASEERAQKESALETVKDLLSVAEHNVVLLKGTVDTLNQTIISLKETNAAQQTIINQLTEDRDKAQAGVVHAEKTIAIQKEQLQKLQAQIKALTEAATANS